MIEPIRCVLRHELMLFKKFEKLKAKTSIILVGDI